MYKQKISTQNDIICNPIKSIFLIIVSVLVISFFVLSFVHHYEEPKLIGRWVSTETGVTVKFTKGEKVTISTSPLTGTYHIISPNTMEYTIDDLTFTMYYHIEDRSVYWGLTEAEAESLGE